MPNVVLTIIKNAQITKDFYSMMQNKFHYAITEKTAAEIIESSADHTNFDKKVKKQIDANRSGIQNE